MFLLSKKLYINNFLLKFSLQKNSLKNIKKHIYMLNILNYKTIPLKVFYINKKLNLVAYIISISINKSNIFFHIKNCFGNELFYYSIGLLNLNKKKLKKSELLQKFLKLMFLKMKFLKNKPLSVHLFNIDFNYNWFIEKLYIKSFILSIQLYTNVSHNGCRKKKLKKKRVKKVAELGLKR